MKRRKHCRNTLEQELLNQNSVWQSNSSKLWQMRRMNRRKFSKGNNVEPIRGGDEKLNAVPMLKKLKEARALLDNIKIVLGDCISVLVDLTVQIGKLEKFFTVLSTVIDNIILVRAEEFNRSMAKAGRRGLANGLLKIDDLEKQTIYVATLQIKAYFSLLVDISSMYTSIDRSHIREGVDLCTQLSKSAASKATSQAIQDKLSTYTESAAKEVAKIVSTKQQEMLKDLKARAQRAAETTQMLEETMERQGLPIDQSVKQAIQQGGQAVKDEAKAI
ncbi:MAG: hypothetical protein Q9180_007763, partial [Flavoplaca navasiana]